MNIYEFNDKILGGICGIIGGMVKYYSDPMFLNAGFFPKLFEAGLTAFVCGVLGVAGKKVFTIAYTWVKKHFKK